MQFQWWLRRAKWCRLNHTDGKTGPEGEIMIAPQEHEPQCTDVYGHLSGSVKQCACCFFSHQDRNVTVCTAHSLCTVYTRVAALLAAQMTPPEIKLNYRRFSRTMIQREMKVNFDFSMLLMVEKWGSLWQRWANTVFWTEYEYEYYSESEFWPNTNTNNIRFFQNERIRIRIIFVHKYLAEYEYE